MNSITDKSALGLGGQRSDSCLNKLGNTQQRKETNKRKMINFQDQKSSIYHNLTTFQ